MEKLLLISLLVIGSVNSYSRVMARPTSARVHVSRPSIRTVSRPSVVRVRPSTKTITHKAAIRPNSIKSIKPIKTSSTTHISNKSNIFTSKPKSITSSSFSNMSSEPNVIVRGNNGMSFFDYIMINRMINNSNTQSVQVEGKLSENNISELIKFLKKEIEEEENKMFPDKEKIKKYKEYINLLQNKK